MILLLALASFAYYRANKVANRNGWQMVTTMKDHYFTPDEEFSSAQGFAFAIALSEPLDPRIGELIVDADEWGINPSTGKEFWRVSQLNTHTCTAEELSSTFMPVNRHYRSDLRVYGD